MDSEFLQETLSRVKSKKYPWSYWLVDDFFPKEVFLELQKNLCSPVGEFRKRPDDEADINYMFVPDINLAKLFLSDEFKFLEDVTGFDLSIHEVLGST